MLFMEVLLPVKVKIPVSGSLKMGEFEDYNGDDDSCIRWLVHID